MQVEAKISSAKATVQKSKRKKTTRNKKKKAGDDISARTKVPCDEDADCIDSYTNELARLQVRSHTHAHTDAYNHCHMHLCTCNHTLAWIPTQARTTKHHSQTCPHMCTLTRTCMYTRPPPTHTQTHMHIHTRIRAQTIAHTCTCTQTHVCTGTCPSVARTHTRTRTCSRTFVCTISRAHGHTPLYTHVNVQ